MFRLLTWGLASALVIILTYITTKHLPSVNPKLETTFEAITNLSYSYCASYVFYLINVHLPEISTKRKEIESLTYHLLRIQDNITRYRALFKIQSNKDLIPETVTHLRNGTVEETCLFFHADRFQIFYGDFINLTSYLTHEEIDAIIYRCNALKEDGNLFFAPEANARNVIATILHSTEMMLTIFKDSTSKLEPELKIQLDVIISHIPSSLRSNNIPSSLLEAHSINEVELAFCLNELNKEVNKLLSAIPSNIAQKMQRKVAINKNESHNILLKTLKEFSIGGKEMLRQDKQSPAA